MISYSYTTTNCNLKNVSKPECQGPCELPDLTLSLLSISSPLMQSCLDIPLWLHLTKTDEIGHHTSLAIIMYWENFIHVQSRIRSRSWTWSWSFSAQLLCFFMHFYNVVPHDICTKTDTAPWRSYSINMALAL